MLYGFLLINYQFYKILKIYSCSDLSKFKINVKTLYKFIVVKRKKLVRSLFIKLEKAHCEVGKGRNLGSKDHTVESDWRRINEDLDRRKVMDDTYRLEVLTMAKRCWPFEEEYPLPQKNLGDSMMIQQGTESRREMLSQLKVMCSMVSWETGKNWQGSNQRHIDKESDDAYPEFEDLGALKGRHETPEMADTMMRQMRQSEPDELDTKWAWSLFSEGAEYVNTQCESEVLAGDNKYRWIFLPTRIYFMM